MKKKLLILCLLFTTITAFAALSPQAQEQVEKQALAQNVLVQQLLNTTEFDGIYRHVDEDYNVYYSVWKGSCMVMAHVEYHAPETGYCGPVDFSFEFDGPYCY